MMANHKLFACFAALLLVGCATPRHDAAVSNKTLIVLSIDGFRADYLDRGFSPTLRALAAEGEAIWLQAQNFALAVDPARAWRGA